MTHIPVIETDVMVIGAGPAGSTLALNLAPFQRVLLIEKNNSLALRIGESLPAAAGQLFADMGLRDAFLAQQHVACRFSRSAWGGSAIVEQDPLRNLDGHGWHLDRCRFDSWLQQVAQERNAALLRQAKVLAWRRISSARRQWELELSHNGKPLLVHARFLVDASGRSAFLSRQLGYQRKAWDKLVCGWVYGQDREKKDDGGSSELHAEAGGWWYSSSLPDRARIVAFYTDADLPDAKSAHDREALLLRLKSISGLKQELDAYGFIAGAAHGFCAAHGGGPDRAVGEGWLAVGDAALTFDPLSAQGLFNSLYTGLAGAEVTHRYLQGEISALEEYQTELNNIRRAYSAHVLAWYGQENRWRCQPFWRRRHVN